MACLQFTHPPEETNLGRDGSRKLVVAQDPAQEDINGTWKVESEGGEKKRKREKHTHKKGWFSQEADGSIGIAAHHAGVGKAEGGVQGAHVPLVGPAGPIHRVVDRLDGNRVVCCQG